jgi:hypothetical protein
MELRDESLRVGADPRRSRRGASGCAETPGGHSTAARLLSISVPEIDRLRRNGELVARRKGRRLPSTVAELQRYADTLPADE